MADVLLGGTCPSSIRGKCFRRCREEGHFVPKCTATVEKARKFFAVLKGTVSIGLREPSSYLQGNEGISVAIS